MSSNIEGFSWERSNSCSAFALILLLRNKVSIFHNALNKNCHICQMCKSMYQVKDKEDTFQFCVLIRIKCQCYYLIFLLTEDGSTKLHTVLFSVMHACLVVQVQVVSTIPDHAWRPAWTVCLCAGLRVSPSSKQRRNLMSFACLWSEFSPVVVWH